MSEVSPWAAGVDHGASGSPTVGGADYGKGSTLMLSALARAWSRVSEALRAISLVRRVCCSPNSDESTMLLSSWIIPLVSAATKMADCHSPKGSRLKPECLNIQWHRNYLVRVLIWLRIRPGQVIVLGYLHCQGE